MRQAKVEKPRQCVTCGRTFVTTAAGIKAHARDCTSDDVFSRILSRLRRPGRLPVQEETRE